MDERDYNTKGAHPGRPLESDELEESPPQFQEATQASRSDESSPESREHPSTELDVRTGQKGGRPGKASSGTHPSAALDIRRRRS